MSKIVQVLGVQAHAMKLLEGFWCRAKRDFGGEVWTKTRNRRGEPLWRL